MKNSPENTDAQRKKKVSSSLISAILVMILIFGIGIMLYPTLADWYNRVNASQTISGYNKAAEKQTKEERDRIREEAEHYNEKLTEETIQNGGTIDSGRTDKQYDKELKVEAEGIMGYLSIPAINVNLPVYHGISEKALQMGAGHLPGSSLPVGGTSTHCVITGHTGLPSARLFTDLDKVKKGDTFRLVILNRALSYEVADIQVVLPTECDSLRIEEGQDLCTLLTCTPYGINDHRLLVTGKRISNPKKADQKTEAVRTGGERNNIFIALLVLLAGLAAAGLVYKWRKRGTKKNTKKEKPL